jgi:hypothetical protein
MAIYKNVTVETAVVLIEKGKQVSGGISKILISNNHATLGCAVDIYFKDAEAVDYYVINALSIPAHVSLVLGDNLAFNANTYDLYIKADADGSSVDLSVTIK